MSYADLAIVGAGAGAYYRHEGGSMSPLTLGCLYGIVTMLASCVFRHADRICIGRSGNGFMYFFMPASSLDTVTQNVYEEIASINLCYLSPCLS